MKCLALLGAFLALIPALASLIACIVPVLLLFVFGGTCYWCLNVWNASRRTPR